MTERKTVVARAEDGLDADRHGNVKSVAYGNAIETRRRDADNLKRITVQGQPFSNHRGVAGKISLPEGVTDVCSRYTAAGLIIPRTKQPSQNRLHAKDVKEIAADADSFRFADLAARGQIESLVGPDGQFGESFLALADLLPHGKGELGIPAGELAGTPVAVRNPDGPQLLGVLDRNGTQANGVNELEDRGVGPDTEGESQDGDDGKAGTEAKKPESMAKVAPERGHSISLPVSDDGRGRMSRRIGTENGDPKIIFRRGRAPAAAAPLHWSLKAGGARVAVWAGACAGSFRRGWQSYRQRMRRSRPSASCRAPGCARRRPCWNGGCASRSPEGPG